MKKFTSLMLMLLFAATTWAQVVEGQMYRLKDATQDIYLTIRGYNGQGESGGYGTVPLVAKSVANDDQVWFFEATGTEGQYYVKSKSGYYITHGGWNINAYNTESATKGIIQFIDNGNNTYKIKNINANKYYKIEYTGGAYFPFCDGNESNVASWTIEIVEDSEYALSDAYKALLNAISNAEILSSTVNSNIGTAIGTYTQETADALAAAIEAAKVLTNETAKESDVETLQAIIDATKITLPIAGKYYQIHSALAAFTVTKAVYSDGSTPRWGTLDNDNKSHYWKAVATESGIAFQNVNDNKYLAGTGWTMSDTPTDISFKILATTESEKGYEYAVISGGRHMHANGHNSGSGNNGNIISYETYNANSASSWYIVEVEYQQFYDITYNFKYNGDTKLSQTTSLKEGAAQPELTISLPYGVTSNFAKPEGNVTGSQTYDFTLTIEAELPFETAETADGITQWYYIQMHTNQPGYIGEIADNNTINVGWAKNADNDNHADFVWGFVGNIWDGIKVINRNRELAMTSTGGGNVTLTAEGTPFFVAKTSETTANATNGFCLRNFNSTNFLNSNYQAGKLSHWSSTDAGSTFFLTECKEHEVSISDAEYATMFLDYKVYIPAEVEAYVVNSIEDGYVSMEKVEGVLPANTGVILKNSGNYTFTLAINDATSTTSLLQGSVEDVTIDAAANTAYYVLANVNGIGFYQAELTDGTFFNNANKAYLPITTTSAEPAAFYSFNFDWNGTTGIENIEGAEENAVKGIYDITGRKIETITAPGIYIINGKKCLVK